MAYIGATPTVGNFQVCDAISVVNRQAAYTLQVGGVNVAPESANHMLVSLNGILQKPGSSFTISGSTMTFASNLATGDVIDFVQILGNVLDLGQPSDATVTSAKLSGNLVTPGTLDVNGNELILDADADSSITADTDDQIDFKTAGNDAMKIDSGGHITMPLQPAFQLNRQGQGTQTISGGSEATIALATERFDQNGDCASNTFTAPVTGKYQLQASFYLRDIDTDMNYVQGKITTSNKTYYFVQSTGGFDATVQYMTKNIIVLADMDASDTASIAVYMPSGSDLLVADETQFSGHLVC